MKNKGERGIVVACAVVFLTVASAASAEESSSYNWSGFYVGLSLGGAGSGNVTVKEEGSGGGLAPVGASYNLAGHSWRYDLGGSFMGGGAVGYNFQVASAVLGLEGEFGYLRLRGSKSDPRSSDTVASTKIGDWYGVLAGRLGFVFDRFLPYVKGGMALTNIEGAVIDACNTAGCGLGLARARNDSTKPSWAFGGGLEYAFTQNWSVKGEYLYIGLGLRDPLRVSGPGGGTAAGSTWTWKQDIKSIHTGRIGISYKF